MSWEDWWTYDGISGESGAYSPSLNQIHHYVNVEEHILFERIPPPRKK